MHTTLTTQRGGVLVMVLVIFAMFLVMMIASTRLVALGFRQVVNQEQRDQAFHVAEAGVNYALWSVNREPANPDISPIHNREVKDIETDEVVGLFDVTYETSTDNGVMTITATAVGRDARRSDISETVIVKMRQVGTEGFGMIFWHHLP